MRFIAEMSVHYNYKNLVLPKANFKEGRSLGKHFSKSKWEPIMQRSNLPKCSPNRPISVWLKI